MSGLALARAFGDGSLSPVDALHSCVQRIDAVDGQLNAIVARVPGAQDAAAASEARWRSGAPRSRLDGVPVTVKNNIPVAGSPTTWGSVARRTEIAGEDELAVARLREAGLVVFALTNVPEFTLEGFTSNPLFGTTRNPRDLRLTPGGSSGGAVASVAAGLSPLAIGTDGGGSIRRPAAYTGVVGYKPSTGLVPRVGALAQVLLDFEVVGPMARSVADVMALLAVMAGPDPRDRRSAQCLAAPRNLTPNSPPQGSPRHRILYAQRIGAAPLDPAIAAAADTAAAVLEGLGHEVISAPLPFDIRPLNDAWPVFGQTAAAWLVERLGDRGSVVGSRLREMAAAGANLRTTRYLEAMLTVDQLRREVDAAYESIDLIMTPATAAMPWQADEPFPTHIDGHAVGPRGHAVYSAWVNACGLPAISLPVPVARDALPIGIQLVGRLGSDATVLDAACAYEAVAPHTYHWPTLPAAGSSALLPRS